jgi:hypothetical protein
MNRGLKITLIVVGSLAVAGGITFAIIKSIRKRKEQKEDMEKELSETQQLEEINKGLEGQESDKPTSNKIAPVRNLDKVLNNSFSQIKGVKLFPAKKSNDPAQGHPYAEGFANIRTSPEVNNAQGWSDLWQNNLLGKISAGSSIGTIVSEQYDNMTPKMRWFKVKLTKKLDGKEYGWVRGDNVTFVPFTKKSKSSFEGAFVQKYNTSNQLGADVFPHSNWMIGYSEVANDVNSSFEGELDLNL